MSLGSFRSCVELWRNKDLSPQRLRSHQSRKLRKLVRHAYDHVPFYRKLFDRAGLTPSDIHGVEDLHHLPITRREDVQSALPGEWHATGVDARACVVRRTGGSTGKPIDLLTYRQDLEYEAIAWIRTWHRLGLKLTDKQVVIKDLNDHNFSDRTRWFQRLRMLRVHYLDLYKSVPEIVEELGVCQAEVIRGSPSILKSVACEVRRSSQPAQIRPRIVFTRGEVLSSQVKDHLESTFQCPVLDCYGATEAGCIAWSCPSCDSYHVNEDLVIVEVVHEGRPVQPEGSGEIVITNLFSLAMPFIRYSLGDLGRLDQSTTCQASSGRVSLRNIVGRTADQIVLVDGRVISPDFFRPDEIPGVQEYQVLHERIREGRLDRFTLHIVKGDGFRGDLLEEMHRKDQVFLGTECELLIRFVDSIPTDRQEQFKRVVSIVSS